MHAPEAVGGCPRHEPHEIATSDLLVLTGDSVSARPVPVRWGIDRSRSIGGRIDERARGAVAAWAADDPSARDRSIRRLGDYPFKRPFHDALGIEAFTRETLATPRPGERVPTLADHRTWGG